jgi:hypothetical protein
LIARAADAPAVAIDATKKSRRSRAFSELSDMKEVLYEDLIQFIGCMRQLEDLSTADILMSSAMAHVEKRPLGLERLAQRCLVDA